MIVYVITTLLSVFFAYLATRNMSKEQTGRKYRKLLAIASSLPFIIVTAIRYGVGQDYFYTYVPYFKKLLYGIQNLNIEAGFYWLTKFIQIFTDQYIWLFIVCSIMFFYFIFKAIFEQSDNPPFSIFLLVGTSYFFIFLNGMRQMMAIAIFLYAIKYIKQRKLLPYLFWIGMSILLHNISLVYLPIYFLYGINIRPKIQAILLIIAFACKGIFAGTILGIVRNTKYTQYIDSVFNTGEKGYITLLISLSILILAWIYYRKDKGKQDDKDYHFYCNLQFIAILFLSLDGLIPLILRVHWNFGIISILLIPSVLMRENNAKTRCLLYSIIFLTFSIYIFYTVGINNSNQVLPYQTIFGIK